MTGMAAETAGAKIVPGSLAHGWILLQELSSPVGGRLALKCMFAFKEAMKHPRRFRETPKTATRITTAKMSQLFFIAHALPNRSEKF